MDGGGGSAFLREQGSRFRTQAGIRSFARRLDLKHARLPLGRDRPASGLNWVPPKNARASHPNLDPPRRATDIFAVKINTLGRILSVFVGVALLSRPSLSHASAATTPEVVQIDSNTFSITREATNAFSRGTTKLKAAVQEDAAKYCTAHGKELKVVYLTSDKPIFSTGFVSAKIVFKALNPGEVEPVPASTPSAVIDSAGRPGGDGGIYDELLKLDDLRKRGILTEEEFQKEKKKVLKHSK
jgi:hypothetical protein